MKKYLKTPRVLRRATLLAMLPVFFLAGCGQKTECEKSIDTAMGTVISQTVYVTGNSVTTTNSKINEKITDVLLQKLNDLEQKELSWRLESAEVARINAAAGEGQTSVSPVMAEWLGRCRQISEESAGAFDVSIGRLSRLSLIPGRLPEIPGIMNCRGRKRSRRLLPPQAGRKFSWNNRRTGIR